jgi:hypothetical protein
MTDFCCSQNAEYTYVMAEACNHARAFLLTLEGASEECPTKKIKIISKSYKNVM